MLTRSLYPFRQHIFTKYCVKVNWSSFIGLSGAMAGERADDDDDDSGIGGSLVSGAVKKVNGGVG